MSVRFQFAGDKDISAGRAGGFGIFKPVSSTPPPAYGTILSTSFGLLIPAVNGGVVASYYDQMLFTQTALTELADVYVKADGIGGSFLDYPNRFNSRGVAAGTVVATHTYNIDVTVYPSCNSSLTVQIGTNSQTFCHNGSYGVYGDNSVTYNYLPYGTTIYSESCDNGDGTGTNWSYRSDGNGSYYSESSSY